MRWIIIFTLLPFATRAQKWEIGGGLGALAYKGDVSPAFQVQSSRLGGELFVRYNAGRAVSLRFNALLGGLAGRDARTSDPLNQARNWQFGGGLGELSARFEYNFLNYRSDNTRQTWTPYLMVGAGLFGTGATGLQPAIPLGVGIKYVLGGNWNLGAEFGARATFTDRLDGLPVAINAPNRLQNRTSRVADMYAYAGLTISYTFYKVVCPDKYQRGFRP